MINRLSDWLALFLLIGKWFHRPVAALICFLNNAILGNLLFFSPLNDILVQNCLCSVIGMPKEKYDPPDPRRMYTIMSSEEAANGKKSYWAELEISGE